MANPICVVVSCLSSNFKAIVSAISCVTMRAFADV